MIDVELAFLTSKLLTVAVDHDMLFKLIWMARDELAAFEGACLNLDIVKVTLSLLIGVIDFAFLTFELKPSEHFPLESILSKRLEDILAARTMHCTTTLNAIIAEDVLACRADL